VRDLLKAWDEALAFYQSNPDEAKAIIAENVGSAPEELTTAFDGVQFYDLSENSAQLSGDFKDTLKDVASVSQSIGLIDAIPDLAPLIDPSYLK
jgi:NitT/TauT family transport system substrate-binding protein